MTDFGRRSGVGDMLKSTYDTNEDGVVDNSAKLEASSKAQVQDHTPKSHAHAQANITNLVSALAGKSATGHTHTESEVTDLAHDADKIKGVEVDDAAKADTKVLAYDTASGKIAYATQTTGGHSYVDRGDPSAQDKTQADLTLDTTWRDLDLSAIVPEGAVLIHLRLQITDDAATSVIAFRKNGNAQVWNSSYLMTRIANVTNYGDLFVACDASRVIEYYGGPSDFIGIWLTVRGWFI